MFSNDILNFILLRSFYLCTLNNSSVYLLLDPASLFVQGAWLYLHIPHPAFVALDIFGGALWLVFLGFLKLSFFLTAISLPDFSALFLALNTYPVV